MDVWDKFDFQFEISTFMSLLSKVWTLKLIFQKCVSSRIIQEKKTKQKQLLRQVDTQIICLFQYHQSWNNFQVQIQVGSAIDLNRRAVPFVYISADVLFSPHFVTNSYNCIVE